MWFFLLFKAVHSPALNPPYVSEQLLDVKIFMSDCVLPFSLGGVGSVESGGYRHYGLSPPFPPRLHITKLRQSLGDTPTLRLSRI